MLHKIALLLLLASSFAQAQDWSHELSGKWKFHPGDDVHWAAPDFDDSGWDSIEVPKAWKDAGYPDVKGYGWYRTVIQRPAGASAGPFGISFPLVDDAFRTSRAGVFAVGNLVHCVAAADRCALDGRAVAAEVVRSLA